MFLRTTINAKMQEINDAAASIGNDMDNAHDTLAIARAVWRNDMAKVIAERDALDEREAQIDEAFDRASEEVENALRAIASTMGEASTKVIKLENKFERMLSGADDKQKVV